MTPGEPPITDGEAAGRAVIKLTETLQDKDVLTEEEAREVLEPICEYVDADLKEE